ncbi:ArsR family transcriptional regulator [Thermaurantiacus tibetensis]|uniref:VpaChn25_0724 family phage protein n=1 Tax=Thermaurantiacus tibetensis TaxID=2759035 RepID=UPI00188F1A3E|nr:ArsR family transcriptional regulator [Thermaurantiacus tibetensis]
MSYRQHVAEHLRRLILAVMAEAPAYRSNAALLKEAAVHLGIPAGRELVRAELAWLADMGLVTLTGEEVAELTARGLDVAQGLSHLPGIARPDPRG